MIESHARVSRLHGGFSRHLPLVGAFSIDNPPCPQRATAKPETGQQIMADEQNNEQVTDTTVETSEAPQLDAEALKAEVEKWRSLSRKNEDRAKENAEAAKAWAEYQEASKSEEEKRAAELEQLRARAAELEASLAAKDREVLAQKVAADKGVAVRWITGETEDEMVAAADEFLADAKKYGQPERRVGYVGSQGTGDPTPTASSLDDVRERAKRFAGKN